MTAPKFTISILCMNHWDLTQKCVESVLKHSSNFELFITDNASVDGTPELLANFKKAHPNQITIITNTENKGFQEPNKHALSLARGEFFILLNNDMEVQ